MVVKVIMIFFYVIILILSIVGNVLVIIIICRFKYLKCVFGNFFIVNFVLCDLFILLISIFFEMVLVENSGKWLFGFFLCKMFLVVVILFVIFLFFILVVILLD